MTLVWKFHHPKMTMDHLGFIPYWISEDNPKGMADQIDDSYQFGGFKQHPINGFEKQREYCLKYPGDPLLCPLATLELRGEVFCFYDHAICAVFQPDGSFVAARID